MAHAIVEYTGAKPVFVDVEKNTGNIDINQIQDKVSNRTKSNWASPLCRITG